MPLVIDTHLKVPIPVTIGTEYAASLWLHNDGGDVAADVTYTMPSNPELLFAPGTASVTRHVSVGQKSEEVTQELTLEGTLKNDPDIVKLSVEVTAKAESVPDGCHMVVKSRARKR